MKDMRHTKQLKQSVGMTAKPFRQTSYGLLPSMVGCTELSMLRQSWQTILYSISGNFNSAKGKQAKSSHKQPLTPQSVQTV